MGEGQKGKTKMKFTMGEGEKLIKRNMSQNHHGKRIILILCFSFYFSFIFLIFIKFFFVFQIFKFFLRNQFILCLEYVLHRFQLTKRR